jgi:hypothetical protein
MQLPQAIEDRFDSIPPSVLLKTELLRRGVRLDVARVGSRHYHHHDERGQKPGLDPSVHVQGSVKLPDGTTIFVAQNAASPYVILVDPETHGLVLAEEDGKRHLCELTPGPRFQWTRCRTQHETPMASIFTPSLGGACGPVALFLLRHCEFAHNGEECRYCSWVRMGKSREMRPDVDDMRETLGAIWDEQKSIGYFAFSGGSLYNRTREADAFLRYMSAVRETGVRLPATVAAIQALDARDSRRLHDAGFDYACYSMEVWDEGAWQEVIPGKCHSVGREHWMECLTDAVKVFGEGRVMCNFVAGVENAVPGLYDSPIAAAESTLAGMRWCCENGIYPKYAVWIVQGGSRFADRRPAPMEYYTHLMLGRQQLFDEFAVPVPKTDCMHCLTQSLEADLARLDPERYALGAAGVHRWEGAHPMARVAEA